MAFVGLVGLCSSTACSDAESGRSNVVSWETFKARSTKHVVIDGPAHDTYVIDGDVPASLEELREYYDTVVNPTDAPTGEARSTVNRNGSGGNDIWTARQEQNLTYCVSNEFGGNKDRVVREMFDATGAWETSAEVRFVYDSSQDGNCNNGNGAVVFSVRPWSSGGACAFFPSGGGCVARTLVIDYPNIDGGYASAPNVRTVGVLRHELGHILGMRHEQNRPPGNSCFEDSNWNPVTDYDIRSVMHYPWCAGNAASDLSLTSFDKQGVRKLYGAPSVVTDHRLRRVDVNGDGYSDIALEGPAGWGSLPVAFAAGGGNWSVTNNGIANFAGWAATPGVEILSGDFNGDGRTDFALTGPFFWGTMPVAMSLGNGSFSVTNYGVGDFAIWSTADNSRAVVGDFNGDGRSDVALTGVSGWGSVPVAFANGDGSWYVTNYGIANFAAWAATPNAKIVVGDINGDGRHDLMLTGPAGWNTIPVACSNGNGSFTVFNSYVGDFGAWATSDNVKVVAGDFDGDARTDIALTGVPGWNTVPIARSNGNGTWTVSNNYVGDFATWASTTTAEPVVGDFNGDGRSDIGLTGPNTWGSLPVAFSTGSSWSVTNYGISNFASWAGTGAVPVVGDFNADGRTDVALSGPTGWGTVPVAFSNGNGQFSVTNSGVGSFADWAATGGVWILRR
jgi:hypothetical protein